VAALEQLQRPVALIDAPSGITMEIIMDILMMLRLIIGRNSAINRLFRLWGINAGINDD
jgi:hypothetical protein